MPSSRKLAGDQASILMDYNVVDRPAYRRFDRYQSYTDFGSIFLLPIAFLVGACVRYILYLRREMLPVHNLMSFLYNSGRDRLPKQLLS